MPALLKQKIVVLSVAAKMIPGRPHINTVRRWCSAGIGGVRLVSWRVGGKVCTSEEAIERFILARSGQPAIARDASDAPTSSHLQAEAKLDSLGVV